MLLKSFLFFCLSGLQFEGRYEAHKQICTGIKVTDIKWSLEVKPNGNFLLQITKATNEYLSKPQSKTIVGTWKSSNDTLQLNQWGKSDSAVFFYQKEQKLFFQSAKPKNNDFLLLDYFSKSGNK